MSEPAFRKNSTCIHSVFGTRHLMHGSKLKVLTTFGKTIFTRKAINMIRNSIRLCVFLCSYPVNIRNFMFECVYFSLDWYKDKCYKMSKKWMEILVTSACVTISLIKYLSIWIFSAIMPCLQWYGVQVLCIISRRWNFPALD